MESSSWSERFIPTPCDRSEHRQLTDARSLTDRCKARVVASRSMNVGGFHARHVGMVPRSRAERPLLNGQRRWGSPYRGPFKPFPLCKDPVGKDGSRLCRAASRKSIELRWRKSRYLLVPSSFDRLSIDFRKCY